MGLTATLPILGQAKPQPAAAVPNPLQPPAEGSIPVAFLLSDNAVVIDFAGPWEVFSNVSVPGAQRARCFSSTRLPQLRLDHRQWRNDHRPKLHVCQCARA